MELILGNLIIFMQLALVAILQPFLASAAIGVNYGMLGNNLPAPKDVINRFKLMNIPLMRLFDPKPEVLDALRGSRSSIKVSLGMKNEDVPEIAKNMTTAMEWVNSYVVPFAKDVNFGWITIGNEMVPGPGAELISSAMDNILKGLSAAGLSDIKVSTVVHAKVLGVSYPPSAGDFSQEASEVMRGIIEWLSRTNNPILINVYPYIAHAADPSEIPLSYALFDPDQPIIDGQYKYYSLFEAMVDVFYAALEKNGGPNVTLVVTETGWPTAGNEPSTSKEYAGMYNQRLINKMKVNGTPRRPSNLLDIMIFAMFNEDQKPSGVEQNWGIFYSNLYHVYPLNF